ncbi:MAG: alpha/beta hydrolase [Thermoanaerobaculia bacterium]
MNGSAALVHALLCGALLSAGSGGAPTRAKAPELTAEPLSLDAFQAAPSGRADQRVAYGSDPSQFADLRVPRTPGPHPVVVLIHGGCWRASFANLRDLAPMAEALVTDGIATWNVEYRRLPQPGSGWPGTFTDVGLAIDHLRTIAAEQKLDLDRVVAVGHSAGGQLALWAAARHRLPSGSELAVRDPLALAGVVDLDGPGDLEAFLRYEADGCGAGIVGSLLGGSPTKFPERYAQSSAGRMLPLGVPQILVWGALDGIVSPVLGEEYAKAAKAAGDSVRLEILPGRGHFDAASPTTPSWPVVHAAIRELLKLKP